MPYRLSWEPCGVYRRYYGIVTVAERTASFDAICGDSRFDGLRYCITDYLDVTSYQMAPGATAEIAARHVAPLETNPRISIAAVATQADILAAIADFKRQGFVSVPYHVFPTLDEARRWVEDQLAGATPVSRLPLRVRL